jgi:hypothetical protein
MTKTAKVFQIFLRQLLAQLDVDTLIPKAVSSGQSQVVAKVLVIVLASVGRSRAVKRETGNLLLTRK